MDCHRPTKRFRLIVASSNSVTFVRHSLYLSLVVREQGKHVSHLQYDWLTTKCTSTPLDFSMDLRPRERIKRYNTKTISA
jgi:hypothetical protein